jgi:hypothetical protein
MTKGAMLARGVPHLGAADSLEDAVRALAATDDEGLPVTDPDDQSHTFPAAASRVCRHSRGPRFGADRHGAAARRPKPRHTP